MTSTARHALRATRHAPRAATLLSLALAGCAVGPDYAPPVTKTPDAWSEPMTGGATDLPADLATWWTTLSDPTLNSLVERAIDANLDVLQAEARIREARAQRGVVAADLWPTVNVGAAYERAQSSENSSSVPGGGGQSVNFSPGTPRDFFSAGFDATWELDFFGHVRRSVEAAEADIGAAVEARRNALVTLLGDVAANYVELRGLQARLQVTRENVRVQQETVDITRSRFQGGLTSELDVARAEAQLASTQAAIPTLESGVHQSAHRIAVLLGREPGALLEELTPAAPIPAPPSEVAVGAPAELLRRRPDIRQAERNLAAATARIGVATADLYPRFSLTGSFGFQSQDLNTLFNSASQFWSVGPAVSWPIFDAGRIASNIKVQDARTEQALLAYQQTVLRAYEDVENALVAYAREQDRRRSLLQAVDADKRAVDLANQLYTRGLTDFLNVLDAQRSLYADQALLVISERTVVTNLVALYKALGGGWETLEPGRPSQPAVAKAKPAEHDADAPPG